MKALFRDIRKIRLFHWHGEGVFPYTINSLDKSKIRFSNFILPVILLLLIAILIFSIPFFQTDGFAWQSLNLNFQGLMFCLIAAVLCHAYLSFRFGNTMLLFTISFTISYAAESMGIRWGWPFCSWYHYNPQLLPMLPGGVPLFIPLSWFMLSYSAMRFVRPFLIRQGGSAARNHIFLKALLCAVYITALDLVIDPIATHYNTWFWHEPGNYFGVPPANFFYWFLISFCICFISLYLDRPSPARYSSYSLVPDLVFVCVSFALTMLFCAKTAISLNSSLPALLALIFLGPLYIWWIVYAWHSLHKITGFSGKNQGKS